MNDGLERIHIWKETMVECSNVRYEENGLESNGVHRLLMVLVCWVKIHIP